jgi:hypothetical protein
MRLWTGCVAVILLGGLLAEGRPLIPPQLVKSDARLESATDPYSDLTCDEDFFPAAPFASKHQRGIADIQARWPGHSTP